MTAGHTTESLKLDDRDRRILAALEADAWLSYAALGKRINLSASAVQRRVERLIAHGAILGAHARLSAEATRRPVQIFTLINLVEDSSVTLKVFVKSVVKQPGVVEAYYLAGEADVVLVIRAQSMESYAAFAENHLNGNRTVKHYQTLTVLKTLG